MPKREWDQSIEGQHPALTKQVDEEELKAAVGKSRLLTNDEKWHAHRLAEIESYRANYELFSSDQYEIPEREKYAAFHKHELARALADCGKFDEALALVGNEPQGDEIRELQAAVERDDSEECDCERPKASIADQRFRDKQVDVEHNRRYQSGQVYSPKHGKVVSVWKCNECGHTNATPDVPERQQRIESIRAHYESLQAQAGKVTAKWWADNVHSKNPEHQDAELLKNNGRS